jgi:phosphoribosyl-AMP cyclohydrolase / phosphoribosyl-ATP pyrophosphohydrolase
VTRIENAAQLDAVHFSRAGGTVAVVAQHARSGEVLMLAHATREALERTLAEGVMCYWSRSRNELWRKGDTSGNVQHVVSLHADCDADAILALVLPAGPSCHTGDWTCFGALPSLPALAATIDSRAATGLTSAQSGRPSYTQRLLGDANLRLKKLGEEAVELALACERGEPERVAEEAADLLYHVLVACRAAGVAAGDVLAALDARRDVSAADAAAAEGGTAAAG